MQPDIIECETCGSTGEVIGDRPDARGERTDLVLPCPDCRAIDQDFDDSDADADSAGQASWFVVLAAAVGMLVGGAGCAVEAPDLYDCEITYRCGGELTVTINHVENASSLSAAQVETERLAAEITAGDCSEGDPLRWSRVVCKAAAP